LYRQSGLSLGDICRSSYAKFYKHFLRMIVMNISSTRLVRTSFAIAFTALLVSCGGGGGGSSGGTDVCSLDAQKTFVKARFDNDYLWYKEVPGVDANAANYTIPLTTVNARQVPQSLDNYFQALKTPTITASNVRKDQFSFTYNSANWKALSQSGISAGYGWELSFGSTKAPRSATVAFSDPSTPASGQSINRGAKLLFVDGVDFVNDNTQAGVNTINAGLFPSAAGQQHNFVIQDTATSAQRTVTMTSANVTSTPVQYVKTFPTATGNVGYMLFNDHIATAEFQLITAVNTLKAANIKDLVLDLRYNGGGYLFIASELTYMIAGTTRSANKWFEKLQYNDKRTADNAAPPTPLYDTSCGLDANFNCTNKQALPTLDLPRVFVITSSGTCSASESIINGLRGLDVQVILIGNTTCGKPYGFTEKSNCGTSYFPIEFQGVNFKNFGDYADGFTATCLAGDDFSKQLGDPTENRIASALGYINTGTCPPGIFPKSNQTAAAKQSGLDVEGTLIKNPLRENAWRLPSGNR
jgi:carboxyl-terminal processing protease